METTKPKSNSADEIELTQFFNWFSKGFSRFGDSIIAGLAAIRNTFAKNRIFFAIIIVLAIVIGWTYSELISQKHYRSTMVLSCAYLNRSVLNNTIEKLNLLSEDIDKTSLAEELNIDIETAGKIAGFDFATFVSEDKVTEMEVLREQLNNLAADKKELVDKVIKTLEIENKDAYQIGISMYAPEFIKKIEKPLIEYFRRSPYIQRRIEIGRAALQSRKTKLLAESNKLDSLKQLIYMNYRTLSASSRGSNNVILGEEGFTDPLDVFREDLNINSELISIERNLYLQPDFEVVDGFAPIRNPESASLPTIIILSTLMGIVFGYVIIGVARLDKYLASYPNRI